MGLWSRIFGGQTQAQPKVRVHVAFDGAVRVMETPTSPGWQPFEDASQGDGFTKMTLQYSLPMEPIPLTLLAKVYTLAPANGPPESPATTDWRKAFQPLFSSIAGVATAQAKQLTMQSTLDAAEATIDGVAADPIAPLRVRERRAVMGMEQFIVTALGAPSAFDEHAAEIEAWFSTSAFAALAES